MEAIFGKFIVLIKSNSPDFTWFGGKLATQINEADEREKQRHLTSASENAKWSTTDVVTGDTTALFIQIQMKYNQTPTRLPEIVVFALKNRLEVSATRLLKFEILPSAEMEEVSLTEPEIESS